MLIDNLVTRLPDGITNRSVGDIFASLKTMDPTRYHAFFDDFDRYAAAEWTISAAGAGTVALTDADGGRLLVTTAALDNDREILHKVGEGFLFSTGNPLFFRALFQASEATESDIFVGLCIATATDPVGTAPTDGVFFRKDDGDTNIDFVATKNSTAVTATAVATLAAATDTELAFFWDGIDRIWYSVNGTVAGYITPSTSLPDDEVLTIFFGLQNGAAGAKTMTVDYLFAAKER